MTRREEARKGKMKEISNDRENTGAQKRKPWWPKNVSGPDIFMIPCVAQVVFLIVGPPETRKATEVMGSG